MSTHQLHTRNLAQACCKLNMNDSQVNFWIYMKPLGGNGRALKAMVMRGRRRRIQTYIDTCMHVHMGISRKPPSAPTLPFSMRYWVGGGGIPSLIHI